ncbi:MAG TPA: pyruvate dehydrogenase (acetyl-transferring) E1 component subunit alpha [Thermoplasmata archaeon]|nr:pyruvate dehydrogenase (acetyl-transferring) E1 component subunit alpha [Thermoplasmata archaeon]
MVEDAILQVIGEDGTADDAVDPKLPPDALKKLYRDLVLVRIVDTRMLSLQRQGRIGFYVPSSGEEAVQIGSATALEKDDWIFPAYREPGVGLSRGFPLVKYINQMYGNAEDVLQGRQMPNHYALRDINLMSISSPVGTQIPHAVGTAWAMKLRGAKSVSIVYFGDGATSEGDFHVSMNFAGVFRVPCVFLCKNNQWAISLPLSRQTASKTLAMKAAAYGFEGFRADGNDVLAVYVATKRAVDKARAGGGPTLVEALTYRMGPHSSSDDPTRYRKADEVEHWRQRDPIERFQRYLEHKGLYDKAWDEALHKEIDDAITEAVRHAEKVPPPPTSSVFMDVYADIPWHIREQMEEFEKGGFRRRPEDMGEFPL